jgi:hypothetical protein
MILFEAKYHFKKAMFIGTIFYLIKFNLQENETLHRETVYMDLDTMLLPSWSSPSIENIIM